MYYTLLSIPNIGLQVSHETAAWRSVRWETGSPQACNATGARVIPGPQRATQYLTTDRATEPGGGCRHHLAEAAVEDLQELRDPPAERGEDRLRRHVRAQPDR